MRMYEWAKREVDLYKQDMTKTNKDDGWTTYINNCADSALKAFGELCSHGHSGMSISMTQSILNRLIDNCPLTPLTGEDDEWAEVNDISESNIKLFQNRRCSSVFKHIKPDGTVYYSDNNRAQMYDLITGSGPWTDGVSSRLIEELYPLTMPYMPGKGYKLYGYEFTIEKDKDGKYYSKYTPGEFNTVQYEYMITPEGERVDLDVRYCEDENGIMKKLDKRDKRSKVKVPEIDR